MTKEIALLGCAAIVLGVILSVVVLQTRKWSRKSDHHLKCLADNAGTPEYAEAHAEDFKASGRHFRSVIRIGAGAVTLVAVIYMLIYYLII